MKSNWGDENFWAKGQGQTSKISDFDLEDSAQKISRTLQFSQKLKVTKLIKLHNQQTNLNK